MIVGSRRKRTVAAYLFLAPSLLGLVVFLLLPICASALLSVTDWDALQPLDTARFVGLANYRELLSSQDLRRVLLHTLSYMGMYIPLVLAASAVEANLLAGSFRGLRLYKVLFYLPVITSWVAGALIWKWILNSKYGFLNNWLLAIGIQGPPWLSSTSWAMPGIVLAAVWKDTGYYALVLLAALKSINRGYYEAAAVDGARGWRLFSRITLPLLSPTIFFIVVVNVIYGFQVFDAVWVMTQGGPVEATTVIVERIYRNAFSYYKMGYSAAYSWVLFAIILAATAAQLWMQKRWVTYDA
jgi:multiple sugar transport system permease protein